VDIENELLLSFSEHHSTWSVTSCGKNLKTNSQVVKTIVDGIELSFCITFSLLHATCVSVPHPVKLHQSTGSSESTATSGIGSGESWSADKVVAEMRNL
jgi:hypothetical protein